MKAVAFAFLAAMTFRHFSIYWLGNASYLGPRGWNYVMTGLMEAFLCAALALVVWEAKKTKWRWLALYALGIGICEGLQIAVCRVLIFDISTLPKGMNACDFVTGVQWTLTVNTLYLLILAVTIGALIRGKN